VVLSLLRTYKKYDPAATSLLEVFLFYPGIKAISLHRLAHYLYKRKIRLIARGISEFSRWLTGVDIHPGAQIGTHVVIDHGMGIVIGETTIIGDNAIIYQGVTLGGTSLKPVKRHPTIGARVIIGAGAKVLGNIVIGADSRIGANAIVLVNVPANSTVVATAARILSKEETDAYSFDFNI
jgi:serine O-acetyltransferase